MVTPNPGLYPSSPQPPPPDDHRALWITIIMFGAVLIGTAGGALAWIGGLALAHAILTGAGGFAGATALGLKLYGILSG